MNSLEEKEQTKVKLKQKIQRTASKSGKIISKHLLGQPPVITCKPTRPVFNTHYQDLKKWKMEDLKKCIKTIRHQDWIIFPSKSGKQELLVFLNFLKSVTNLEWRQSRNLGKE